MNSKLDYSYTFSHAKPARAGFPKGTKKPPLPERILGIGGAPAGSRKDSRKGRQIHTEIMKIFVSKMGVFGIPSRIVPGPRRAPGGTAWRPGPDPGAGKLEDSSTFSPSGSGRAGSPGAKCSPKRTRGGPTKDPRRNPFRRPKTDHKPSFS